MLVRGMSNASCAQRLRILAQVCVIGTTTGTGSGASDALYSVRAAVNGLATANTLVNHFFISRREHSSP
jgi:hypothetical protein